MNEFERKLQQQPMRRIPPQWRSDILRAAHADIPSEPRREAQPWFEELRQWFWPCPQAWAGLAALWVLSAVLQLSTPARPVLRADQPPSNPPSDAGAFAESRKMLAQFLESPAPATPAVERPKLPVPGPRSERRHELVVG